MIVQLHFAANKECKTQTKNPPVSNGKIACHEQTRATSNCNFDRGQGTHMHQQSETVEDWTNGELSSTQLLHQLLASAEAEHDWSPILLEHGWRKESENSTFQSKKHMVHSCGSSPSVHRVSHEGKCGWHEPNDQSTFSIADHQPHRAEQHVMRRQKFLHHMRGVASIISLPSIWLCLVGGTLVVGGVWKRDIGQVFVQVLDFLLADL